MTVRSSTLDSDLRAAPSGESTRRAMERFPSSFGGVGVILGGVAVVGRVRVPSDFCVGGTIVPPFVQCDLSSAAAVGPGAAQTSAIHNCYKTGFF